MAKKKQKVVAPVVRESEVDKLRKLDDATIEEKIKEYKKKYGLSNDLVKILLNTVNLLDRK